MKKDLKIIRELDEQGILKIGLRKEKFKGINGFINQENTMFFCEEPYNKIVFDFLDVLHEQDYTLIGINSIYIDFLKSIDRKLKHSKELRATKPEIKIYCHIKTGLYLVDMGTYRVIIAPTIQEKD